MISLWYIFPKESFDGVPKGYDNLFLSNNNNDLGLFSLDQLQTDIQNLIDSSTTPLQNQINKINTSIDTINTQLATTLDNYVKYDDNFLISNLAGSNDMSGWVVLMIIQI
jgi:hypothetical protein